MAAGAIAIHRFFLFTQMLALCAFLSLTPSARGEEAEVRAERFDGLIEALNTTSSGRARILEMIYAELRGTDGREMQEVLRQSLSRQNTLILLGVVEAMAMLGDSRDVTSLEAFLATSDKLEVKTQVIRLLPAFCLQSERARFNYITYAVGYERTANPSILEPLRRPPLTRRGRLDASLERLRGRIERGLAAQFDPVGAALRYIDDVLFGAAARRTVVHYVGNSLGNDPSRWASIWAVQGGDTDFRVGDEVEEIRLASLAALADMGAEGRPEVIDAFKLLFATGSEILQLGCFEAMSEMCRIGFQSYPELAALNFSAEDAVEGDSWRNRRYASDAVLALFAAETAMNSLGNDHSRDVFAGAVDCLGAALSYPDNFPDADGGLAAMRARGEAFLEVQLMRPDLGREERASAAKALGDIGSARAVAALTSIIDSPYASPAAGSDGTRMAEATVDALRNVATGEHSGKETAREALLRLLGDERDFAPIRPNTPPVGIRHMVLWRLQRLARTNDIAVSPEIWRERLGW